MVLILAAVQFAFGAAFAALSRWVEAAAFAALGIFFAAAFFGIPDKSRHEAPPEPDAPQKDVTAGDLAYLAKSGSYWLSSVFFYLSLFGMAYGAGTYFPELPVRTMLGGVLSAVSAALLVLYAAAWKKGVPQVALVFRINALLLSGISAGSLLYASLRGDAQLVPWVFWSHAGLSAAALATTLFTDRFAERKFLTFLLGWSTVFSWAACTYLVSLFWPGWESATLTAAAFGLACFWLPESVRLPSGWGATIRVAGACFTLAAQLSAAAGPWWGPVFPVFLPVSVGLAVFHVWMHREFRNWLAFGAATLALCAAYVQALGGIWGEHGFAVLALCAAGLPALVAGAARLARLRAVDAWFAQYAASAVMAGYAYAGWQRFGFGVFEWSALLMLASLVWYAAWTANARKSA